MLTCKQFLQDLNEYLEDTLDPQVRTALQKHVNECPNCWVVCDTTQKTIKIYKGMDPQALPPDVEARLKKALMEKCKRKREKGEQSAAPPSPS